MEENNKLTAKELDVILIKERKDKGLCVECGREKETVKINCNSCIKKRSERTKKLRLKRKEQGLCTKCGKQNDTSNTKCLKCSKRESVYEKRGDKQKTDNGLCIDCNLAKDNSTLRCYSCLSIQNQKRKTLREKRQIENGCRNGCNEPTVIKGECEKCWFREYKYRHKIKNIEWQDLKSLLESQNYTCPYSGEKIIPGVNASLDHIVPISKSGTSDISNLQWTTKRMNLIKNDCSHEEFVALCHLVAKKFPSTSKQE